MADGPDATPATWEARPPPVRAYVLGMAAWLAFGLLGWRHAFPFGFMIWATLCLNAGVQAVRVAFWSRTWLGRLAPAVFLLLLALHFA